MVSFGVFWVSWLGLVAGAQWAYSGQGMFGPLQLTVST